MKQKLNFTYSLRIPQRHGQVQLGVADRLSGRGVLPLLDRVQHEHPQTLVHRGHPQGRGRLKTRN